MENRNGGRRDWRKAGRTRHETALSSAFAFTLVELLVVIAVLGVLFALLLPVLASVKTKAKRLVCLNNVRQIGLGIRLYCDDERDFVPTSGFSPTNLPWIAFKELMKPNLGLGGPPSSQDSIFACPADTFHYKYDFGYVNQSRHNQSFCDYSSYNFNGMNLIPSPPSLGRDMYFGIGGRQLSSIGKPEKTVLVAEAPAFQPYSWHNPQPPPASSLPPHGEMLRFNNAKNVLGFVDGHASYTRIYWDYHQGIEANCYEPPAGFDYQWTDQ